MHWKGSDYNTANWPLRSVDDNASKAAEKEIIVGQVDTKAYRLTGHSFTGQTEFLNY